MHTKVIFEESGKFFFQIKWEESVVAFDECTKFEICVTDGKALWKGIRGILNRASTVYFRF
jgi:hypothetical protein